MKSCQFVRIYDDLIKDILSNWLDFKSIGRFDCSLCEHTTRDGLIDLFNCVVWTKSPMKRLSNSLLDWMCQRRARLTCGICFTDQINSEHNSLSFAVADISWISTHCNNAIVLSVNAIVLECTNYNTLVTNMNLLFEHLFENLEMLKLVVCTCSENNATVVDEAFIGALKNCLRFSPRIKYITVKLGATMYCQTENELLIWDLYQSLSKRTSLEYINFDFLAHFSLEGQELLRQNTVIQALKIQSFDGTNGFAVTHSSVGFESKRRLTIIAPLCDVSTPYMAKLHNFWKLHRNCDELCIGQDLLTEDMCIDIVDGNNLSLKRLILVNSSWRFASLFLNGAAHIQRLTVDACMLSEDEKLENKTTMLSDVCRKHFPALTSVLLYGRPVTKVEDICLLLNNNPQITMVVIDFDRKWEYEGDWNLLHRIVEANHELHMEDDVDLLRVSYRSRFRRPSLAFPSMETFIERGKRIYV